MIDSLRVLNLIIYSILCLVYNGTASQWQIFPISPVQLISTDRCSERWSSPQKDPPQQHLNAEQPGIPIRHDVRCRHGHDGVLCTYDFGHGDILLILLRHGVGFFQPQSKWRGWAAERECRDAAAWIALRCRWAHSQHLCTLWGRHRELDVGIWRPLCRAVWIWQLHVPRIFEGGRETCYSWHLGPTREC